ncbi:hypothetical protein [Lacipirellula sp.]
MSANERRRFLYERIQQLLAERRDIIAAIAATEPKSPRLRIVRTFR